MNTVPAGTDKPFEVAFGVPGLFVAMTVKDVSVPAAPLVIATVTMEDVGDGQYVGLFSPVAGKRYAVLKQAYTDGTYVTPDPNYYPGSEAFEAISAATIQPADILELRDAVWTAGSGDYTTPGSFGWALDARVSLGEKETDADGRYQTIYSLCQAIDGQAMATDLQVALLVARLTTLRAAALDRLDVAVSSRESEAAADARAIAAHADALALASAINGVLVAAETPDAASASALALLVNATYGLAALETAIATRATDNDMATALAALAAIEGALADGTFGLAALETAVAVGNAALADGTTGLAAIKAAFGPLASSASVAALPTAAQAAAAVWGKATADAVGAGSYGERLASRLDAAITTRAPGTATDAISAAVAANHALLVGTNSLAAIRGDLLALAADVASVDSDVAACNSDVLSSKAAILAAISLLVDGTPDLLAELATIKGAFVAGDDLHSIRAAIGTGSATLAKQDAILAVLDAIKGGGWSTQTLVALMAAETSGQAALASARLSLETKTDQATAAASQANATGIGVTTRLDHPTYGLDAAKSQRDAAAAQAAIDRADELAAIAAVGDQVTDVGAAEAANLVTIMAGFDTFDLAPLETAVAAILALSQDGVYGFIALKTAIASLTSAEAGHAGATATALGELADALAALAAELAAAQGGGFDSTASLRAIADALAAMGATVDLGATSVQAAQAILLLHELADGNTGDFDATTDSLHALGAQGQFLEGVTTGV